jgi:DNA-binding Lrp family transcriptional regulator
VNWRQIDLGDANLDVLRRFFREHLCATQVECAEALGLSTMAVNRHVRTIRAEWCARKSAPRRS